MSSETPIEILRRVHCPEACIEVGEWPDSPSCIELRTVGASNIQHFGKLNLTLDPSFALALGQALIDAAVEKGAK